MIQDYIIDFERVNELTTSIYDDPDDDSNPYQKGKFSFSVSRKLIREYLDKFSMMSDRITESNKTTHIINTLEYNGIIIHKSTIRDNKLKQILNEEGR